MSPKRYCEIWKTPFFDQRVLSLFRFDMTKENPIARIFQTSGRGLSGRVVWHSEEHANALLWRATGTGDSYYIADGEFVAVLPGTYGVEYYHKLTGEKAYQLGVVID